MILFRNFQKASVSRLQFSRQIVVANKNIQRAALFSTSFRTMATEFKLKGLTSIDLKNGQKQECEVEGIDGGKVLLAKVRDEVHAMSANCTHYGAPLIKGVLTGEGRITCPWHGG